MHNLAYDLFCGAGGATLGLLDAGMHPVIGFENWGPAIATHRLNGLPVVEADLSQAGPEFWKGRAIPEVMWASPPCQPFSTAGRNAGHWDPRDGIPWYLNVLSIIRPPVTVWENVKGLTYAKHRPYLDRIVDEMRSLGYTVEWRVLCAADYGVPQARYRLICIGRRDLRPIRWPVQTHARVPEGDQRPWVTMAEALGWGFTEDPAKTVCGNRSPRWGYEAGDGSQGRVLHTNRGQEPDGRRQQVPDDRPAPTVTTIQGQWKWAYERPATTVQGTPRIGRPGHKDWSGEGERQFDKEVVPVTSEEAAVLQGFPEHFVFTGNKSTRFKQVGNAVPPRLVEAIVRANR